MISPALLRPLFPRFQGSKTTSDPPETKLKAISTLKIIKSTVNSHQIKKTLSQFLMSKTTKPSM